MSMEYGGYFFIFNEVARAQFITKYIERGDAFTDTISAPDWEPKTVELCFLSFDGQSISYAALTRRGKKVATRKYHITFQNYVRFEPISFDEIEKTIESRIRSHFIRVSSGEGSRVPPKTWTSVFNVVKKLRPEATNDLDELERIRNSSYQVFEGLGFDVLMQEKDAFGLALKIFGINLPNVLLEWTPPDEYQLPPFLQGLTNIKISEDVMISNDSNVFGDWMAFKRYQVGAIEFRRRDRDEVLTIMNVNRTKIEKTLGVDLLYYHHKFKSFVLVQYKRMEKQNGKFIYRPIDVSYKTELQRMKDFQTKHSVSSDISLPEEYRLYPKGFYFKLCELETFKPSSNSLISGMYIPIDYWEILMDYQKTKGPRGGILISRDNVDRYIHNTLFVELVQNGWIGSRGLNTDVITKIVYDSLNNDKSVMIAISKAET